MIYLVYYTLWVFVISCIILYMIREPERTKYKAANTPAAPNNEYKIIRRSIATLKYFCIFNRSGDCAFGAKGSSRAWNSSSKAIPRPVEVYVYQTEAVNRKR